MTNIEEKRLKSIFEFNGRAFFHQKNSANNYISKSNNSDDQFDYIEYGAKNDIEMIYKLNRDCNLISEAISQELSEVTGLDFEVRISFKNGSIEWIGYVVTFSQLPLIQAAANIGGAIGLAQLIGTVITKLISKTIDPRYKVGNTNVTQLQASLSHSYADSSHNNLDQNLRWLLIISTSSFIISVLTIAIIFYKLF